MGLFTSIIKAMFTVDENLINRQQNKPPDTSGSREVWVKQNGTYHKITINKYGEIISRSDR